MLERKEGYVAVQGFLKQDINMARQCREHTGMSKTLQTTNENANYIEAI